MNDWKALLTEYRIKAAELALVCAKAPLEDPAKETELVDSHSDAHSYALDRLLMTPAPNIVALREKLCIIDEERIDQNWSTGRAIFALLACDAERLITGSSLNG